VEGFVLKGDGYNIHVRAKNLWSTEGNIVEDKAVERPRRKIIGPGVELGVHSSTNGKCTRGSSRREYAGCNPVLNRSHGIIIK
jgi:hypothetical protein